jgi:hypothetical protein
MRKSIIAFLTLLVTATIWADDYKILKMNTPSIKIGKRICKSGDVFSDQDKILWSADKQAIKVQNLKTKEIRLFVGNDFFTKKSTSIKDYYVKTNHLSTRGNMMTLDEFAEQLPDTLYLWEDITMELPFAPEDSSFFFIAYKDKNGSDRKSMLETADDSITVSRQSFDSEEDRDEITVSFHYHDGFYGEDSVLKDTIRIIMIPDIQ